MKVLFLIFILLSSALAVSAMASDCASDIDPPLKSAELKALIRNLWSVQKIRRNLNQIDAAAALGVSQGAFSRLLNDRRAYHWTKLKVKALATYMGVPVTELLPDEFSDDQNVSLTAKEAKILALENLSRKVLIKYAADLGVSADPTSTAVTELIRASARLLVRRNGPLSDLRVLNTLKNLIARRANCNIEGAVACTFGN